MAKARSRGVKTCATVRQAGMSCSRPVRTLVTNVETAHEVELLEDHGAVRPPGPQLLALEPGDIVVTEEDLTIRGVDQPVQQAQAASILPAPERPMMPTI